MVRANFFRIDLLIYYFIFDQIHIDWTILYLLTYKASSLEARYISPFFTSKSSVDCTVTMAAETKIMTFRVPLGCPPGSPLPVITPEGIQIIVSILAYLDHILLVIFDYLTSSSNNNILPTCIHIGHYTTKCVFMARDKYILFCLLCRTSHPSFSKKSCQ